MVSKTPSMYLLCSRLSLLLVYMSQRVKFLIYEFGSKSIVDLLKMASERRGTTLFPRDGIFTATESFTQQSANLPGLGNQFKDLVPINDKICDISPWEKYKKFMELDQAGPASLAFSYSLVTNQCKVVAIKSCSLPASLGTALRPIENDRVVQLEEFFTCGREAFLVYEPMAVTLVDLLAVRRVLTAFEIAVICKEVKSQAECWLFTKLKPDTRRT
jgi:hypothetical protein